MPLNVKQPKTVYIKFTGECPKLFQLWNDKSELYFFRYLDGKTPRIKFNIVEPGVYKSSSDYAISKIVPIETPSTYPKLPPAQRSRFKDVTYVFNPNLQGTPARIFTDTGIVEHSPLYYSYPKPIRLFIDLHESGHLFYSSEIYCDLWALINYLRMGYNRSMAYYTLAQILKVTPANIERLKYLLTQIDATQENTNSELIKNM